MNESIHLIAESTNEPLKRTTERHLSKHRRHGHKYDSIHRDILQSACPLLSPYTHQTEERPTKIPNHTHIQIHPSLASFQGHLISKPQTTLQCENFVSGYSCQAARDKPNTNRR